MNELVYKASESSTVRVIVVHAAVSVIVGRFGGPLVSDQTSAPARTRGGRRGGRGSDIRRGIAGIGGHPRAIRRRVAGRGGGPGQGQEHGEQNEDTGEEPDMERRGLTANHDGTPGAARARLSAAPLA